MSLVKGQAWETQGHKALFTSYTPPLTKVTVPVSSELLGPCRHLTRPPSLQEQAPPAAPRPRPWHHLGLSEASPQEQPQVRGKAKARHSSSEQGCRDACRGCGSAQFQGCVPQKGDLPNTCQGPLHDSSCPCLPPWDF